MAAIDILFGFLAGVVSCLTPQSLLLIPLLVGAAGATNRAGVIALAVGLGLANILTGALAGSFATLFGLDANWFRGFICVLLILQGIALMSRSLVARYPRLTGGDPMSNALSGAPSSGVTFRKLLLALFVGANWLPLPVPVEQRAMMMAADSQNPALTFGILFAFGVGAALPWIVLGRIVAFLLRPVSPGLASSMTGRRILGLTLVVVAGLGISGYDVVAMHWLDAKLPDWSRTLATRF